MKKRYYVTTPIYYPSDKQGRFHIGTSYTSILADFLNRYKKMCGYDTYYLTGMDEHGQKISDIAKELGISPQKHVDNTALKLKNMFELVDVKYDDFIRTTEERHKTKVQDIFTKLLEKGDIYLGEYEGDYCKSCESYYTKSQLKDEKFCPDCGAITEKIKEKSYFLKLSKYESKLLDFIEKNPDFIRPKTKKNEVVSFIKSGLQDLCVSRTSIDWGIKVPRDEKHIIYVWLDALTNYITALGYGTKEDSLYEKYWLENDEVVHVLGKDILRFHAIYWPIIIMALEIPIKFKIFAHNWYMMKNSKMSKSKGNVIYPEPIVEKYGSDALRFYLLNELTLSGDGSFDPDTFIERYNANLVNDLSNLLNRTIAMVNKYQSGKIYPCQDKSGEYEADVITELEKTNEAFTANLEKFNISESIKTIWKFIRRMNKYIDQTEPWIIAKDENLSERLNTILFYLVDALRNIAILLNPLMPNIAVKILEQIGIDDMSEFNIDNLNIKLGAKYNVVKNPTPIFMRLDVNKEKEEMAKMIENKEEKKETEVKVKVEMEDKNITIEDFAKVDIRIGEIVKSEKHPKADRLLVSQVDLGEKTVQIVSGIAEKFSPDSIIGQKVLVVKNLKPVKLRGVLSEGMILLASDKEKEILEFVTASNETPNGSKVK